MEISLELVKFCYVWASNLLPRELESHALYSQPRMLLGLFLKKNQQDLYKSLHYVHYSQSNSTNENLLKLESKTVWHADHLFKAWHAFFFQYAQPLLLLMNKQVP